MYLASLSSQELCSVLSSIDLELIKPRSTMAVFSRSAFVGLIVVLSILAGAANAQQLSDNFYSVSCRNLSKIVRSGMESAVRKEPRMAASILRLFFHDCFVNVSNLTDVLLNVVDHCFCS